MKRYLNRNQMIADRLDRIELSDRARTMIEQTDFNMIDALYGDMTKEQIEELAKKVVEV